jgi:hypothetical protein
MPDTKPLVKASCALDEWWDEFAREWKEIPLDESAPWPEQEDTRRFNDAIAFFRPFHERIAAVLKTILQQRVAPALAPDIAAIPRDESKRTWLDLDRASLLPADATWLFECLDAAFLQDVIDGIQRSVRAPDATRRELYVILLQSAVEGPISPIASWYLERATRLLLLGLHPECIAMCRAVLAAALRFRFDDADLDRVGTSRTGGTKNHRDFSLADLCWGGSKLLPDAASWKLAHTIRIDGNSVLHPDTPERFVQVAGPLDATKYVVWLSRILRTLFPAAGA